MNIDKPLNDIVKNIIAEVTDKLQDQIAALAKEQVVAAVKKAPVQSYFDKAFADAVAKQKIEFPTDKLELSGDQITGGIIKQFGSTGIDDKATACQLTILDDVTVVENNLLTKNLTVKGDTQVEGNLTVAGKDVRLQFGTVTMYSSSTPPKTAESKGTIVFNSNPTLGGPLGWISLGEGRWANFGFID
jgi:hypothetical protein